MISHPTPVLLPLNVSKPFTYIFEGPTPLQEGQLVRIPFRGKDQIGVVWSLPQEEKFKGTLKPITSCLPFPPIPLVHRDFMEKMAAYTLSSLGNVLRLCLSAHVTDIKENKKILSFTAPTFSDHIHLSEEQQIAARAIGETLQKKEYAPFLLDGITGSGKTEVYLAVIEEALKQEKQVLVLLPEISLTTQWLKRFERRFGCLPLQWHSALTPSQRRQIWQAVLRGEGKVVVGARSGLFLPFPSLGLIIVDEEHDGSFKQEEQVIYNGRDMAVLRAHLTQIPIVLASATPSLETLYNAQRGRYKTLLLKQRHGGAILPTIKTIDMRQQPKGWLSLPLLSAMAHALDRGEQVMLFLNRRGYAPLTLCRCCGYRFTCLNCQASLVEHRRTGALHCHHCGHHQPRTLKCPQCAQEDTLVPCGPGVERILELVEKQFPKAKGEIITSDQVTCLKKLRELIQRIDQREIDILIGTQILAKGHHFPLITLVGVVDGDLGLSGGDLRCSEKTYQLLHQVAGRAGRAERPGNVYIQTFNPDHPLMGAIVAQDREAFVSLELKDRQLHGMPPFGRLAAIIISGTQGPQVSKAAVDLGLAFPSGSPVILYGPAPAPLAFIRGRHRWRFLLKAPKNFNLQYFITLWLQRVKLPSTLQVNLDIDPYSFV